MERPSQPDSSAATRQAQDGPRVGEVTERADVDGVAQCGHARSVPEPGALVRSCSGVTAADRRLRGMIVELPSRHASRAPCCCRAVAWSGPSCTWMPDASQRWRWTRRRRWCGRCAATPPGRSSCRTTRSWHQPSSTSTAMEPAVATSSAGQQPSSAWPPRCCATASGSVVATVSTAPIAQLMSVARMLDGVHRGAGHDAERTSGGRGARSPSRGPRALPGPLRRPRPRGLRPAGRPRPLPGRRSRWPGRWCAS